MSQETKDTGTHGITIFLAVYFALIAHSCTLDLKKAINRDMASEQANKDKAE